MVGVLQQRDSERHPYGDVLAKLRDRGVIGLDGATRRVLGEATDKVVKPRCDWYFLFGSEYVLVVRE
jgi:hypothetical protein